MWMQQPLGMQCVTRAYPVAGGGYPTYGRPYHDSRPAAHSDCRTNLQTSTVLEDAFLAVVWLSCNFYWYCSDSSIDLHTPLLHNPDASAITDASTATPTNAILAATNSRLLILCERHAVKKVPVAEEDSDDSSTDDGAFGTMGSGGEMSLRYSQLGKELWTYLEEQVENV
ncbi:hypothetical protein EDD15DRAFT_2192686 [Pisolithus albus]|nr:hypothetical protein EDD15DRAFT_2192686 [Pisolithus albus]